MLYELINVGWMGEFGVNGYDRVTVMAVQISASEQLFHRNWEDGVQGDLDFFGVFGRMNDGAYFDGVNNTIQV